MRVLLDESVPRRLGAELVGHEVQTVPQAGWAGLTNGELLRRANGRFDVLITADQNLEFQQNRVGLRISVVVLVALDNRIETLRPLIPSLLQMLPQIGPGKLMHVSL
ncbi:MAG: DUF5615 family PIN-like protein [Betaproteobacteria bacterium]|nr:DUF5615 family PIN-like protein [Betaproteobacteria bacterium]